MNMIVPPADDELVKMILQNFSHDIQGWDAHEILGTWLGMKAEDMATVQAKILNVIIPDVLKRMAVAQDTDFLLAMTTMSLLGVWLARNLETLQRSQAAGRGSQPS